jgi:two-component system LytT family response regulator
MNRKRPGVEILGPRVRTGYDPQVMDQGRIRTLIVDDEPLARDRIRSMLAAEPDLEVVGECSDGRQAAQAIREKSPDLLFLDIQMPEMDGFEVLAEAGDAPVKAVIFVTAYDHYAIKAFEVNALDYLLKPFDRHRFQTALGRARERLRAEKNLLPEQLAAALRELEAGRRHPERILVRSLGRIHFVKVGEISWVEAAGNYVKLHVGSDVHLLRETMQALEARLDPERFLRIHRSTMVNIDRIKELQPLFHGDYVVILKDGTQLTMSRGYREHAQARFGPLA